jgi:hypothetical protein
VTTVIVRASCEDVAVLRKTIHEWIIREGDRKNELAKHRVHSFTFTTVLVLSCMVRGYHKFRLIQPTC